MTPPMGVDTWLAFGTNVSAAVVLRLADELEQLGLKAAGYRYVWLDAGWYGGRDSAGHPYPDAGKFPDGMRAVADNLHARGLKLGIYTAPWNQPDDYRQQEARTYAAWGVDAVKVDHIYGTKKRLNPRQTVPPFVAALRASGRPMLVNVCVGFRPNRFPADRTATPRWPSAEESCFGAYAWAPAIADTWRTDTDLGVLGQTVPWRDVLRNFDSAMVHPEVAKAGRYNDPDYITPAGWDGRGLQTWLSLWAIAMAPLMISADLGKLPGWAVDQLKNPRMIAINQDRTERQGVKVADGIYRRPLANGNRALLFLNRSRLYPVVRRRDLGGVCDVVHVWSGKRQTAVRSVTMTLAPRGCSLLRIIPK
jgi:alpha-galactosidase